MEPDVPMPAPPGLPELGGGSLQPNQPLGGANKPARSKPVIKRPTKPKPDKSLRFSLDPNALPPKQKPTPEEEVDDDDMPPEDERMPHKRPKPEDESDHELLPDKQKPAEARITSYNVCYTKLLRLLVRL